jgi:hypothetical protein
MKQDTITTKDIIEWIDNDEGLYNWFNRSRQSKAIFIKENRETLIACIQAVISGSKPAHFLAY